MILPLQSAATLNVAGHYFVNKGWFESEDWLLKNAALLTEVPTIIVQGRYDVICPVVSAWKLHKAMPQSELFIIPDAGHSAFEPGIARALVAATDRLNPV